MCGSRSPFQGDLGVQTRIFPQNKTQTNFSYKTLIIRYLALTMKKKDLEPNILLKFGSKSFFFIVRAKFDSYEFFNWKTSRDKNFTRKL